MEIAENWNIPDVRPDDFTEHARMISRRRFNGMGLGALGLATAGMTVPISAAPAWAAADASERRPPVLLEKGRYTQPWFLESFLDLRDDLAEAQSNGKRFAIMWDQVGCPYCTETQQVNFAIPEVQDYIKANFEIVQLDIWGGREVTNFDGARMTEKKLARHSRVRFTPTIQFFPETLDALKGRTGQAAEVARMPGYFRPYHFLVMFQYVRDKGYETGDFRAYMKARLTALRAEGKRPPAW